MKKKSARRSKRIETRLIRTGTPVFLLDDRRRLSFFNSGCEQLTGWRSDEVVGLLCEYRSESAPESPESLIGSLCPPPEVLAGRPTSVASYVAHKSGDTIAQLIHFFPLCDDDDKAMGTLGVITNIDEPSEPKETPASQQLHAELAALRLSLRRRFGIGSLACQSPAMIRVLWQIELARHSTSSVLLQGEAGTGREHIARVIHYEGPARHLAFVPLDCQRLSAFELKQTLRRLLESIRSEPGDADAPPSGLQLCTLYLQNVEHLSRDLQQFLVEEIRSDNETAGGSLRLMSSTSEVLRRQLGDETFRDDFFHLITPLVIDLPPLRHRQDDIELLAQSFLEGHNRGREHQLGGFTEDVWLQFREYNWPGNVDELSAVIEEACVAADGHLVRSGDLPFRFRTGREAQSVSPRSPATITPLEPLLARVEREEIERALDHCRNNRAMAAKLLGITRQRLYRRMQSLGIDQPEEEE